jgi:hypothetical protein
MISGARERKRPEARDSTELRHSRKSQFGQLQTFSLSSQFALKRPFNGAIRDRPRHPAQLDWAVSWQDAGPGILPKMEHATVTSKKKAPPDLR